MKFGLVISVLMHASLMLLAAVGLPDTAPRTEFKEQPLLVDLVDIAEVTTPQEPELAPPLNEQPPPPPKIAMTPPPPPPKLAPPPAEPPAPKLARAEPMPLPMPRLEKRPPKVVRPAKLAMATPPTAPKTPPPPAPPAPKLARVEPMPLPMPRLEKRPPKVERPAKLAMATPPPAPITRPPPVAPPPLPKQAKPSSPPPLPKVPKPPKAKPRPIQAAAPKPKPRPLNKPKPPKKKTFTQTLSRIAALLDKAEKPKESSAKTARQGEPRQQFAAKSPQDATGERQSQLLTMTEVDAIRLQIEKKWNIQAGAQGAEDLIVRIRIFLNPDGSLAKPPEVVNQRQIYASGNAFYRAAAESARRAVNLASPLRNLPPQKYEQWREVTLSFDPREVMNQ